MIAAVSVFNSQIVAIHRTYLKKNEDGSVTKADVGTPKMLLGPISGGSVQLSLFQEGCRLIIAEGIETALSVLQACPEACVWAVLSASNFHNLTLPPKEDFSDIIIAADHDKAGINAAEKTANKWTQEGYRVKIALPDREGEDFNHVLNEQGVAKVVELIHKAVVVEYKETIEDQLKTLNKGIDESFVLKADGVYHRRKIKGEDERVDVKLCSYLAPTHQIRGDESDPQWSRLMALKDNDGNVYDHILSMGDLAGDGASYRETLFSLGCLKEII